MDFLIFFYTFNIVLGGKGGAEVVVFKKTNKKRKVQRKMLGFKAEKCCKAKRQASAKEQCLVESKL